MSTFAPSQCTVGVQPFTGIYLLGARGKIIGVKLSTTCLLKAPVKLYVSSPTAKKFEMLIFHGNSIGQVGNNAKATWTFSDRHYKAGGHYNIVPSPVTSADGTKHYTSHANKFTAESGSRAKITGRHRVASNYFFDLTGYEQIYSLVAHKFVAGTAVGYIRIPYDGPDFFRDPNHKALTWTPSGKSDYVVPTLDCGQREIQYVMVVPNSPTVYGSVSNVVTVKPCTSPTLPPPTPPAPPVKHFANCTAMHAVPALIGGVGKPGAVDHRSNGGHAEYKPYRSTKLYSLNSGLDRDQDGIAC